MLPLLKQTVIKLGYFKKQENPLIINKQAIKVLKNGIKLTRLTSDKDELLKRLMWN